MRDFTSHIMYVAAIYRPEPGLENRITSMIEERNSLANLQSVTCSDELAVVSYMQIGFPGECLTYGHERDLEEIEEAILQNGADYVICYREVESRILLDQSHLVSLGRSAIELLHLYQPMVENGELPEPDTYHWIKADVSQLSGETVEPTTPITSILTPGQSYDAEYILPVSRIVVGRELRRILKETGITTGTYTGASATSPRFSEAEARVLIRRIPVYIKSISEDKNSH